MAVLAAGADVNARFRGPHHETPLHWAASSNDVAVLDALLDAGADIEARGAVIAGGTALADATALVERGAHANLFEAAAVGLLDRVAAILAEPDPPAPQRVNDAFWAARHGGQTDVAQLLLDRGAELNWLPAWEEPHSTPPYAARQRRRPPPGWSTSVHKPQRSCMIDENWLGPAMLRLMPAQSHGR